MNRPDIDLRIERLVIRGVPRGEAERIARATRTHLERLLAERGVQAPEGGAGAGARLSSRTTDVESSSDPARVGRRIASAVHGALGS